MLYTGKTFTLPASSGRTTSQKTWDLAFLSRDEFQDKYGEEPGDFVAQIVTPRD